MAKLEWEDYPEEQDAYGGDWTIGRGKCWWDPETEERRIKIIKPKGGTEEQKKRAATKVLRHELGHNILHMDKYSKEESLTRERNSEELIQDEVDVAVWEYKLTGNRGTLKARLRGLAEAYLYSFGKDNNKMSRTESVQRVSAMAKESAKRV